MDFKRITNIDESFFDIDKDNKTARIELRFGKPSDIFDFSCVTKIPILNDDFIDCIMNAFRRISSKYKLDLSVRFDDMEGYSEDGLADIFKKNIELELRNRLKEVRKRRSIAISLMATGILFFVCMMLVKCLWDSGSVWMDMFVYTSDIATTVTFWEALTILVVEQKENRAYLKDLGSRFARIRFSKTKR